MHSLAITFSPVLAAEKSKVPFFIAGGVLVLAAVSTAVITAGPPAKSEAATAAAPAPPTPGAPGTPTKLTLAANPSGLLSYNTKQISAKAGSVTINFTNAAPLEHNVTIAEGSKVLGATPTFIGGSRTLTLTLKPGTYTFYCSVPGHRQSGMEGTLSVT